MFSLKVHIEQKACLDLSLTLTFQKDFFYYAISDMLHKIFSKFEHLTLYKLVIIFIVGSPEIRMKKDTFCKGLFVTDTFSSAALVFQCYFLNHKSKLCLSRGSWSSVAWMSYCYLDLPLNVIFKLQREPRPFFFYIQKNCNRTFWSEENLICTRDKLIFLP